MEITTVEELFAFNISKALGAAEAILENLLDSVKKVEHPEFKKTLQEHIKQTEGQIRSLTKVFDAIGQKPESVPCVSVEALIQELDQTLDMVEPELRDSVFANAFQKAGYFQIATYKTLAASAEQLALRDAVRLLTENCSQEEAMAKRIEQFASSLVTVE